MNCARARFWPLSAFGGYFVQIVVLWGRAGCPLSGVERCTCPLLGGSKCTISMGNRGHGICPLYRGCPPLGESVIRGFTVVRYSPFLLMCSCTYMYISRVKSLGTMQSEVVPASDYSC